MVLVLVNIWARISEVSRTDKYRNYLKFHLSSNCVTNIKDKRLKKHKKREIRFHFGSNLDG